MPFTFIPEFPPHHRNNGCLTCRVQRRTEVEYRQGGERLIDLGVWIDSAPNEQGFPAFVEVPGVICETCARELGAMVDLVEADRGPYRAVVSHVKSLEAENAQLRDTIAALRQAKDFLGEIPEVTAGRRG